MQGAYILAFGKYAYVCMYVRKFTLLIERKEAVWFILIELEYRALNVPRNFEYISTLVKIV